MKTSREEKDQPDRYSVVPTDRRSYKCSLNCSLSYLVSLGLLLLGSCANESGEDHVQGGILIRHDGWEFALFFHVLKFELSNVLMSQRKPLR